MAVLIFKLRYVPDDEAQEVREILSENGIEFYETTAGVLGFSLPGIWLSDDDQAEKARQLIDAYQQRRQNRMREEYRLRPRSYTDLIRENPLRYLGIILAIILVVYFMVLPLLTIGFT